MSITKAKRRAAVTAYDQPDAIRYALRELSSARTRLRDCGAKNAADYVARAMKSAEGALRHAERMCMEEIAAAKKAGWDLDRDLWWRRPRRDGDIEIREQAHFGFTAPKAVYVRNPAFALAYDRGEITAAR